MTTPTCNCDNVHLQREIAVECQCLGCHPYTTKVDDATESAENAESMNGA